MILKPLLNFFIFFFGENAMILPNSRWIITNVDNKFETFLHKVYIGPIFFYNIRGWVFIRLNFGGNLLEKSAFLASKLGDGHLLEQMPLIEFIR